MSIVDDVQDYLVTEGLVGWDSGWVTSWLRHDESDRLVLIQSDAGPEPEVPASGGLGSAALRRSAVLITVRGPERDAPAAYEKVQEIYDALHGLRGVVMGSRPYMLVRARSSEPAGPFVDDSNRPEYTISFIATAPAVPQEA